MVSVVRRYGSSYEHRFTCIMHQCTPESLNLKEHLYACVLFVPLCEPSLPVAGQTYNAIKAHTTCAPPTRMADSLTVCAQSVGQTKVTQIYVSSVFLVA